MAVDISAPKGEISWVRYYDEAGVPQFLVTSNKTRDRYFLYKINGEKLERIGKARFPSAFDCQITL